MRLFIENNCLKVEIDSAGAEIKSVMNKKNNQEYMWYGNKKYWGRTAPILFPFVGASKDKQFIHNGQVYPIMQHGFARDYEHKVISQSENAIWFSFKSNEETIKIYPFEFELQLGYELDGNNLKVCWKVINPSNLDTLYFSIGAHPAFLCPVHGEDSKEGYKLFFGDGKTELNYHEASLETGLTIRNHKVIPLNNGRATLAKDTFDYSPIIVEGKQTDIVGIEDKAGNRVVDVKFDMPLFVLWSPEGKNAPFICIEPWMGRGDAEDFAGELKDKEFGNTLPAGQTFDASYVVTYY